MALPNIFDKKVSDSIVERIQKLHENSTPEWGVMSAPQMLAHCNVTYEMVFENIHAEPNAILKFVLQKLVKNKVVGDSDFSKNSKTASQFIIKGSKNFEEEKTRLINYIYKAQELGANYFDNKESHSFGKLKASEWNNMFYKHLNHHLSQFGV